jgi:phosphomannomutase
MGKGRTWNVATLEQSNGWSILGGPPKDPKRMLGEGGHVRDKDGTFAAVLVTEVAAYAKREGTDILSLLAEHVYADPDVGLFVNYYEPDPLDGEYPGLEGDTKKKGILDRAEELFRRAQSGGFDLGGRRVTSGQKYATGKYDAINDWPGFPDEGIRLYFGTELDYLTVRPSGTTNSLRFHVQFHEAAHDAGRVWERRVALDHEAKDLVTEVRDLIGAPRQEGVEY